MSIKEFGLGTGIALAVSVAAAQVPPPKVVPHPSAPVLGQVFGEKMPKPDPVGMDWIRHETQGRFRAAIKLPPAWKDGDVLRLEKDHFTFKLPDGSAKIQVYVMERPERNSVAAAKDGRFLRPLKFEDKELLGYGDLELSGIPGQYEVTPLESGEREFHWNGYMDISTGRDGDEYKVTEIILKTEIPAASYQKLAPTMWAVFNSLEVVDQGQ
ncbi:MAG: hypothetical protein ACREXY_15665 [Gammaproteobacteria bacterium]